jgi:hypothetical protein
MVAICEINGTILCPTMTFGQSSVSGVVYSVGKDLAKRDTETSQNANGSFWNTVGAPTPMSDRQPKALSV